MTVAARSSGRALRRAPRGALPTAVRRQSMMTASAILPIVRGLVGQVVNLRPIVNRPLVGQPILAAAGFQPALFASRFAGLCRKRRSRQESPVARVNAL